MDNNLAFRKQNYIIIAVGIAVIVLGYILMAGSGSNENEFNPDIFSAMRIKVAPIVCLLGFATCAVGVMWKGKQKQ